MGMVVSTSTFYIVPLVTLTQIYWRQHRSKSFCVHGPLAQWNSAVAKVIFITHCISTCCHDTMVCCENLSPVYRSTHNHKQECLSALCCTRSKELACTKMESPLLSIFEISLVCHLVLIYETETKRALCCQYLKLSSLSTNKQPTNQPAKQTDTIVRR